MGDGDWIALESTFYWIERLQLASKKNLKREGLSAPVEAALQEFAQGLDQLIKETLNKVREE